MCTGFLCKQHVTQHIWLLLDKHFYLFVGLLFSVQIPSTTLRLAKRNSAHAV